MWMELPARNRGGEQRGHHGLVAHQLAAVHRRLRIRGHVRMVGAGWLSARSAGARADSFGTDAFHPTPSLDLLRCNSPRDSRFERSGAFSF